MKYINILFTITFIFAFTFCSEKNEGLVNNKVLGHWEIINFKINHVHAHICIPFTDTINIYHRIKTNFTLDIKEDSSFILTNINGPKEIGKYKYTDSSLTLINENIQLCFRIDSINNNRLSLYSKNVLFYTDTNDSIHYYTGKSINLTLKKNGT